MKKTFHKIDLKNMLDHTAESLLMTLKDSYDSDQTDEHEKKMFLALYYVYLMPLSDYIKLQPYYEDYADILKLAKEAFDEQDIDFKCACTLCDDLNYLEN